MNAARKAELLAVEPTKAHQLWRFVEPMLAAGFAAADEEMPKNMLELIESRHAVLWIAVVERSAIVAALATQLEVHPSGLVCKLMSVGGSELNSWRGHIGQVEEYAKAEGCIKMRLEGRDGWERALPGYRRVAIVIEKEL